MDLSRLGSLDGAVIHGPFYIADPFNGMHLGVTHCVLSFLRYIDDYGQTSRVVTLRGNQISPVPLRIVDRQLMMHIVCFGEYNDL